VEVESCELWSPIIYYNMAIFIVLNVYIYVYVDVDILVM